MFSDETKAKIASSIYSVYSRSYRVKWIRKEQNYVPGGRKHPLIFAHWHEDDLAMLGPHRNQKYYILISLSRDGLILAESVKRLGYRVVRGSSSRGGAKGLIQLIRKVRQGNDCILTVDGPKGPRRKVKSGITLLSLKTGVPIMPAVAVAKPRFVFKRSWSKTYLPAPFARVVVAYGKKAVPPPPDNKPESLELCRIQVEEALLELHYEALKQL